MRELHCSVTCVTCTKHEDAPLVLVEELADHDLVGDDHHEKLGGCFALIGRHLDAYPEHELTVEHATPELVAERAEALRVLEAARAARGKVAYLARLQTIAERRARITTGGRTDAT